MIIKNLAVKNLKFHEQSIAHEFCLDATACGDVAEFGLTAIELLTNPWKKLKQKFIKVEDYVKPDGLTLLHNVADDYVISAWQSKNWNMRLDAAAVEDALKSLDPQLFFKSNTNEQQEWIKRCDPQYWHDRYIRVSTNQISTAIC